MLWVNKQLKLSYTNIPLAKECECIDGDESTVAIDLVFSSFISILNSDRSRGCRCQLLG
jgi:hypothetical protein